jgi:uncharacterized membrane protein YjgN (DUF898 family)
MKNYFDFTLTGKKFLPVWLLFYLIFLIPMGFYYYAKLSRAATEQPNPYLGLLFLAMIVIGLLVYFLIAKITIKHIHYGETSFDFQGRFWTFTGKVVLGMFLTIITLGIYAAWFIRDLERFFINSSSHNGHALRFNGSGAYLFVIMLVVLFIPSLVIGLLLLPVSSAPNGTTVMMISRQLLFIILVIPYYYLFYKWLVDINFKEYHIHWKTEWMPSVGKIALEIVLAVITLGIYLPLAYLKLFAYFSQRTIAQKEDGAYVFGYDIEPTADFLFIWGQLLLTIITVGFYYPWAYAKIGKRILSKTYVTASNDH